MQIQAVRGMNDLLPQDSAKWQQVEKVLRATLNSFAYQEVRMPLVEKTNLFCRAIGEVTDVVEKEMYTFVDRSGDSLSLRPEGTAGCVRAVIEHNLSYNQEQRLWYMGPMFRHERPQKGRYRQFHQLGVECFGLQGPDIDAEIIALSYSIWQQLGIADELSLQLNSLGSKEERAQYKEALVAFLEQHFDELDEDCKRRTHTNPLRVLDTKDQAIQELLNDAPKLQDYFGAETKAHFAGLTAILESLGIKYEINPRLVRGLDYYNLTVFEWVTKALGAQGTVCGGGRYDGLVEQLGGPATNAVGFGLGLERLVLLMETLDKIEDKNLVDVYIVGSCVNSELEQAKLVQRLRQALPQYSFRNHCGGGKFKNQFKKADKCGARVALILGDEELANNKIGLKDLHNSDSDQLQCSFDEIIEKLTTILA